MVEHLSNHKKPPRQAEPGSKVPQGSRHLSLLETAAKLKNAGLDDEAVEAALMALRDKQLEPGDDPVTDEEVERVLDSV